MADEHYQDPLSPHLLPKPDPSKDALVSHAPEAIVMHDAIRKDCERLGLKSPLDHGCFQCGKPGSNHPCCNEVICDECCKWFYPPAGHKLSDHLQEQPAPVETEWQKLQREHDQLVRELHGTTEDQMRRKIAALREMIATRNAAKPEDNR